MKRILPLILALVAGMAKADSNSDYRAGSDFARQIQGQGTGSIQSFKPQESIPGYNANPDETKYYGGVTAGGDGGLKNDGTTEWATGETGKTITESFMNKPKDILSPDAPFIQTGRDVVNRADSIVGNTGQQCSAQQINRSEFTNYTCERDTMVEETPAAPSPWYSDDLRGHRWRQRQRHHACAVCRCRTPSSRARAVLLNDGGWWSPWHCHSCVGRRPDISAELAGGGILWLCGGLASAFTVARRAGADVVGRARGTADRLSLSHSQRCHLQPHAARTSRPGTRHGLGGDAKHLRVVRLSD